MSITPWDRLNRLSWTEWLWHRITGGCATVPVLHVLVRLGLRAPQQPALGEVWHMCPTCGRVLFTRPETPIDAAQFGLSTVQREET